MSDLYARLGVGREATTEEIRKAYKDLAKRKHPDRGGNAEEFKGIQEAHEVLIDDQRRRMYNMTGAVNEQGPPPQQGPMPGGFPFPGMFGQGVDMGNIFNQMFGGPGRKPRVHRGPNKHHDVGLSLEDFYKGRDIPVKFNQARRCTSCRGTGAEATENCGPCNGQGVRTQLRQIGPGMMAQTRSPCDVCSGEGTRTIRVCRACQGKKYNEREKQLDVKITPGMRDGEQILFAGECSDSHEFETPGDVVLTLRRTTTSQEVFEWRDDDLWMQKTVSFVESILGFHFVLATHPNGQSPAFSWRGGPLIHGAVVQMTGMGMPRKKGGYGNLYVQIAITPPPTAPWSAEDAAKLQSVLGGEANSIEEGLSMPLSLYSSISNTAANK